MYEQTENADNLVSMVQSLVGSAPKSIFEPGCGTAKVLFPLSRKGHIACGMDVDGNMLFHARQKVAGASMCLINTDILIAP